MPLFARKPAVALTESGEVIALVSEPAQRSRGAMKLSETTSGKTQFLCNEVPGRRERLGWAFISRQQQVDLEPVITPIFVREVKNQKNGDPQTVRYLRHAQGLEVSYIPTLKEYHIFFWWNLFSPAKQTRPATTIDYQINSFLSSYKMLPISWTLPLNIYEPHVRQLVKPDPSFSYMIGDPPLDPGGAWPGIYNGFDFNRVLAVGGSAWSKNYDPFPLSDSYLNLPGTPGLITASRVQHQGTLINLSSIEGSLYDSTRHLYHQREIQATRMATRCLMFSRGYLYDLQVTELLPDDDDSINLKTGLNLGSSELTPAVLNESYVGINKVIVEDTTVIFPYGAVLPGFLTLIPGEIGHQFQVTGGQEPYTWCLRRTRSSESDPARTPLVPSSPPPSEPYPFNEQGDLIDPEPDFPDAVTGGGLPPGMLLNRDGLFYGTPTRAGTFLFRIHVRDQNGLRGEATIHFVVLQDSSEKVPCTANRGFPVIYKTTITQVTLPKLSSASDLSGWEGKIQAVGGQSGKYSFIFSNATDSPRQQVPQVSSHPVLNLGVGNGILSLTVDNQDFSHVQGVWVFEVQAIENLAIGVPGPATCDRRAVSLSVGTTRVAGIPDGDSEIPDGVLPEGKYSSKPALRTYLIIDPPVIVEQFTQGKNVYLRGNGGFPLRPDLGGLNISPGIVTSINPGVVNPVQVIGIGIDTLAPAQVYQDWTNSDPVDYFRDIYDRFDPVPVSPAPPTNGGGTITGAQIDDQISVGKRIRPLWPV